jgi:4-amino-4-deoxy-L-arabinose transferase-like glycosyltransferase
VTAPGRPVPRAGWGAARRPPAARPWAGRCSAAPAWIERRALPVAVLWAAAALRLAGLGRTRLDPFYDAAVRSMGTSWHAFLVGAYDPSARLAIDKPPVDLWLQVASTKLLGFTPVALLLPAALGGILAVAGVMAALRTLAGPRAAWLGGLALAVLPAAVVAARSDTMDAVMAALLAWAFAAAVRGVRGGGRRWVVLAGALVGLGFEVKLFEALLAVPPLAALWWLGAPGAARRRVADLVLAGGALCAVGVAWLVLLTFAVPARERPWAFGSRSGSAWRSAFVYDGWDRLAGTPAPARPPGTPAASPAALRRIAAAHARQVAAAPAAPGPLRLLAGGDHLGRRLGLLLVAAFAALALAGAVGAWGRADRPVRAALAALAVWLALGTLLFSAQAGFRPRYAEALDPAIALAIGLGGVLARPARLRAALVPVLSAAALVSGAAAAAHAQVSGAPGALPPARVAALGSWLRARQGGARYEAAFVPVASAGPLIAHDGRPVLMLEAGDGHPLVGVGALARLVATGAVRAAVLGHGCTGSSTAPWYDCSPAATWIRAHGRDVSAAAVQPRGFLYALGADAAPKTKRRTSA